MASTSSPSDGLKDIGAVSAVDGGRSSSSSSSLAVEVVPWADRIVGSIAQSRKVRGGNYVQLATVDAGGHPRCRTVVFRGFQPVAERGEAQAFKMITDARSEKVGQVAGASNRGELVWWFSKSSEQYRVAGTLELVGPAHASSELVSHRRQQWGNLSDNAREQFFWAGQPGDACDDEGGGGPAPPAGGRDAEGVLLPPPDAFLLLLLWPEQVKYLRLTDNFSQVDKLEGRAAGVDGAWEAVRVNP